MLRGYDRGPRPRHSEDLESDRCREHGGASDSNVLQRHINHMLWIVLVFEVRLFCQPLTILTRFTPHCLPLSLSIFPSPSHPLCSMLTGTGAVHGVSGARVLIGLTVKRHWLPFVELLRT